MRRVCRSKKNKKQDKQEENVLRVVVAAAEGDPHSLSLKVVTLDTSQSPMGWLNLVALLKATFRGRGIRIRNHEYEERNNRKGSEETTMRVCRAYHPKKNGSTTI